MPMALRERPLFNSGRLSTDDNDDDVHNSVHDASKP